MNIIDIVIILLIILGAVIGFKQGAIKRLTSFVGMFVVVIAAFLLKNPVSVLLYENLPFTNCFGLFNGVAILNVLMYEIIAFLLVLAVLTFALRVVLTVTGLVELLLKLTVFLSIPSKIFGIFVGALEAYVYVFIFLVILNLPFINFDMVKESTLADKIVNESFVISDITRDTIDTYSDVYEILKNDNNERTSAEINEDVLDIFIEHSVVTEESAIKLINMNKINVTDDYYLKGDINSATQQ